MTDPPSSFPGGRSSPILVGRDDLLELTDRRLAGAQAGSGGLLLLAGEAGIGKTRLLGAIERRAAAVGFRTIRAQTFPEDREDAGAPFLDLAGAMSRTSAFAEVGAAIGALLVRTDPDAAGDARRRRRLLVIDVVDLLASVAPPATLIAIENMAYADDLSLAILAALARRLPELPLVVVGTYRSDELYPGVPMRGWRARLLTERLAEEVRLPRLSLKDTATMAGLILHPGERAPGDLIDAVFERTDGIPLHIEELLGVVLEQHRRGPEGIRAADVPDTLDEAIRQRLDGLSNAARTMLRAASVVGHGLDLDLLADLSGKPAERQWPALEELLGRFFLVPAAQPDRYDFRHALIRDAAYQRVSVPEKRRLHSRVANLFIERGESSDALLSHHLEQAGRRDEAFTSAVAGAKAAAGISSHREAFELYRRALRNVPRGLEHRDHADVLADFAAEAAACDDNVTASAAYEDARSLYATAGAVTEAAALVSPLAAIRHLLGDNLNARIELLQQGLDDLRDVAEDFATRQVRGRLLASLGGTYLYDLRIAEAQTYAEEALALAVEGHDEPTELHALITVANMWTFAGRVSEGMDLGALTIRRARDSQLESEAARGYRIVASTASEVVEYERAERWFREGAEYAERVESWNDRHYMLAHLGLVLWATGRWGEATNVAEQALADGRAGVTTRITALYVLGYVALGRGDWPRARQLLGESLELGAPMGEILRTALSTWGLAETALLAGETALAVELCERGRAASGLVGDAALLFPFLVTGTRAYLALLDSAGAARWMEQVEAELRRVSIPGTLTAIDHARGLILLANGSTGRARESLETAMRGWDESGRVWEGTWARMDMAACLLRSNRPADAVALIEDVRSIGDHLGSRPIAARASELLREARARHPSDEPWRPLTAREFEVARLVAAGKTNAQIAAELEIAPKTASAHVEHILAKLGAGRRAEIAVWASAIARPD